MAGFASSVLIATLGAAQGATDLDANPRSNAVPTLPPTTNHVIRVADGKYRFTFDSSAAPEMEGWMNQRLVPVVREWYPKIVELLPSPGYEAPLRLSIEFRSNMGGTPAFTSGDRITCNAEWFQKNLRGEATGCVVHEMVHVVQHYGGRHGKGSRPGWLTEGIADYIRWFKFEPQSHGAVIRPRNAARVRYDASYRVSGNFLDWVTRSYGAAVVPGINRALREGDYNESLWRELTGYPVEELDARWHGWLEHGDQEAPVPKQASN